MTTSMSLYDPLKPFMADQFRVLHLHPRKDWHRIEASQEVVVTGHLEIVDLAREAQVPYETISYAWDDAMQRESVLLSGQPLDVPRSTCDALRAVSKDGEVRVVWIDAICINQEDLDERAHQLGVMSHIYQSGQRDLFYIGSEDH